MRLTFTIEATEPQSMQDLLRQLKTFHAASTIQAIQLDGEPDIDERMQPIFNKCWELEELAPKTAMPTILDIIAALDIYSDHMMRDSESEFPDCRDTALLKAMRSALLNLNLDNDAAI